MRSICCNARPYEVTSIKEMSGTCNECRKPTMFVEEVDIHAGMFMTGNITISDHLESMGAMWDVFLDNVLGNDKEDNDASAK